VGVVSYAPQPKAFRREITVKKHVTYANVAATLALIVAVAGGSTAVAVTVNASKKSDVNKKGNIRAGRVTATNLADGNVTAAKLAGVDIVQSGGERQATAACPPGERLLSGGGSGALGTSAPSGSNGWTVQTSSGFATAYALCLKSNTGP
jgi:hypothetical protein